MSRLQPNFGDCRQKGFLKQVLKEKVMPMALKQAGFFTFLFLASLAGVLFGLTTEKITGFLIFCIVVVFYFFYPPPPEDHGLARG